jgi:glycosyltransferase involved in cell wall biosynthesis
MKIVHVITRLIIGGAQENTLLSCEGQHDLGHEVTLITGPAIGPEGTLMDRAKAYGYRVEVLDEMRRSILPVKDFRSYIRLTRRIEDLKPDVVHTHSSKAGIVGRWAADRAKVPVVIHTIHGLAFTASTSRMVNWVYRSLEKQAAPLTTKIVCVADAMREQSLAAGIGSPGQYVTVYSGMEVQPFVDSYKTREEVRRRLGIGPDDVVAGTIARLFHLKGHDDLLENAERMCERFPKLKFLWVGDGILRPQFEARMEAMGLRDRFVLTGMVKPQEVPQYVGAMDILVHPSRREGLARALPQGQLAGKPVVAYDVDGNRDGFVDGESGVLVPAFDVEWLVEGVERLAGDEGLRGRMGAVGRAFAIGRFDKRGMVEALDRVYRECLAEVGKR